MWGSTARVMRTGDSKLTAIVRRISSRVSAVHRAGAWDAPALLTSTSSPPSSSHGPARQRLGRVGVAQVGHPGLRRRGVLPAAVDDLGEPIGPPGDGHDRGPPLGEHRRQSGADARRGAGHEDGGAVEVHGALPARRIWVIADLPIVSGRIEANPNARLSDGHVILGHDGSMDPRAGIGLRDEHLALRDSVRGWAARHCPPAVVRTGLDADEHVLPPFWGDLAGQGWIGIAVDEAAGGEGYGLAEAVVVVEELGRVLAPGPFVPSSLAAVALDRFGGVALRPLVGELASGRRVGTVAVGPAPVPATPTSGRRDGRGRGVGRGPVRRGRRRAGPADRPRRGRRPHRGVGGRRRRRRRRLACPVARPDPPGRHRPGRPARAPADRLVTCPPGAAGIRGLAAVLLAAEGVGVAAWCVDTAAELRARCASSSAGRSASSRR